MANEVTFIHSFSACTPGSIHDECRRRRPSSIHFIALNLDLQQRVNHLPQPVPSRRLLGAFASTTVSLVLTINFDKCATQTKSVSPAAQTKASRILNRVHCAMTNGCWLCFLINCKLYDNIARNATILALWAKLTTQNTCLKYIFNLRKWLLNGYQSNRIRDTAMARRSSHCRVTEGKQNKEKKSTPRRSFGLRRSSHLPSTYEWDADRLSVQRARLYVYMAVCCSKCPIGCPFIGDNSIYQTQAASKHDSLHIWI